MFAIVPFVFILAIIIIGISSKKNTKKMVIKKEVTEKYEEIAMNLISQNTSIKSARFKYKMLSYFTTFSLLLSFVVILLYVSSNEKLFLLLFFVLIAAAILAAVFKKDKELFNNVIPDILKSFKSDLKYDHYKGIDRTVYREARFESYDRYRSDDYLSGKIGDTSFEMSEVHTENEYRDKDGHTHYQTIFHGLFSKVTLNKNFNGYLNIVNNRIKLFNRDQYITIDNEAFEKIYDVFTDDKIKSMRLLTPDVTTKMIDLYNETGLYFELKIVDDNMYIRLYTGGMFNFSLSSEKKESKQIAYNIAKLDLAFKIMENIINELERFDV